LINASGQVGRAVTLAITTAIQTSIMAQERGVSVKTISQIKAGDPVSLKGTRVANWFNFALGIFCMVLCAVAFRGTGIVGNTPDQPSGNGDDAENPNGIDAAAADAVADTYSRK
jgi:hypothetical protein